MLVARILSFAAGGTCPYAGMYLAEYTPHKDNKGVFTYDLTKAKVYPDVAAFMADYRLSIGTRPDGKPDRPITAFDLEVIRLQPPYPFCGTPAECHGKGYCPKDPACNN